MVVLPRELSILAEPELSVVPVVPGGRAPAWILLQVQCRPRRTSKLDVLHFLMRALQSAILETNLNSLPPDVESQTAIRASPAGFTGWTHVAFLVDIGLRGKAARSTSCSLNEYVDHEGLHMIAVQLPPQRLWRPPAADKLSKWLSSNCGFATLNINISNVTSILLLFLVFIGLSSVVPPCRLIVNIAFSLLLGAWNVVVGLSVTRCGWTVCLSKWRAESSALWKACSLV